MENINEIIESYKLHKQQEKALKAVLDNESKTIKEYLKNANLKEFNTDKTRININIRTSTSVDEEKLLKIAKTFNSTIQSKIIETKEFVNQDSLTKYLESGEIEFESIKDAFNTKYMEVLNIGKPKKDE